MALGGGTCGLGESREKKEGLVDHGVVMAGVRRQKYKRLRGG